jgi:membrane glycosyltransferase
MVVQMDGVTPITSAGVPRIMPGMPPPAPTPMPEQRLDTFNQAGRRAFLNPASRSRGRRRLMVFGAAAVLTAFGGGEMALTLFAGAVTPLTALVLALFVVNFAWISLAFVHAVIGTVIAIRLNLRRSRSTDKDPAPITGHTAVLMPVYNERPDRTFSAIEAMARGIATLGHAGSFDWFVLSDTTDARVALTEYSAFISLRDRLQGIGRVYYRRRRFNTQRKAGNIADFCRRWSAAYDYLLILDADSLMEPGALVELARRMDADPDAGVIQTVPGLINARTALGRLQQFANRVYGPVLAHGIAWWTQGEGNYWGHNAIIRRKAFTEAAGLPTLSGRPPFGGHILSHDFVEAALIRRAGYTVRIAADIHGSYEEGPTSLIDLAARDRRWCQGNLQHARIVGARGLSWVSRFHLLNGILSYLTSPLWLLMIVAGLSLSVQLQFDKPDYFTEAGLPVLPVFDPQRALLVLAVTCFVLFAPKFMGLAAILTDRESRRAAGGGIRLTLSVLFETIASALAAPIAMLMQSRMIVSILLGHDAGWKPQRREDGAVPLRDLWRFHGWHVGCGVLLAATAWAVSEAALAWLAPAVLGMVLALPVSALGGSARFGTTIRRLGLLKTPQETIRPPIAHTALAVRRPNRLAVAATPELATMVSDSGRRQTLLAIMDRTEGRRRGDVHPVDATAALKIAEAHTVAEALSYLTPEEHAAVLASPDLVERLAKLPTTLTAA